MITPAHPRFQAVPFMTILGTVSQGAVMSFGKAPGVSDYSATISFCSLEGPAQIIENIGGPGPTRTSDIHLPTGPPGCMQGTAGYPLTR
jgi:hypothetical protein